MPPSLTLEAESEPVRTLLEELDDVVFKAIQGDSKAMEQVHQLWPRVLTDIGSGLVEESREQYLRYATDLLHRESEQPLREPAHAIAALEVIELLTR